MGWAKRVKGRDIVLGRLEKKGMEKGEGTEISGSVGSGRGDDGSSEAMVRFDRACEGAGENEISVVDNWSSCCCRAMRWESCRVGHQAIRVVMSSAMSKSASSMLSSSSSVLSSFDDECGVCFRSILTISTVTRFIALVVRLWCTSRYSYIAVTVVSLHPISTTKLERHPAAKVCTVGVENRVTLGFWKLTKIVVNILESN